MARIRTIKPEFPQSESMGDVSRDARLLFIELWTICDDEGRTRAASRMLASLLFPYDDDAPGLIDGWISELEQVGCVVRYTYEGATYLQVCNWLSHQKIDKPSQSKIPEFDDGSRIFAKSRECSSVYQGVDQGVDQGGEARGDATLPLDSAQRKTSGPPKRATQLPADFLPNETGAQYAKDRGIDAVTELGSFKNHHAAKGSVFKDWQMAWRTWCDKAVQFGNGRPNSPVSLPAAPAVCEFCGASASKQIGRRWFCSTHDQYSERTAA
jgi:hypothetical protein